MTEQSEITQLAAESVSSLARLVSAAVLPAIQEQIMASEKAYNLTLQTHLEIMQSQGRRIDNLRTLYNEQGDLIGELRQEVDNLVMRHRLANTKIQSLDGARAGHQNHIASLFDQLGQLQSAMTEAESAIADLEDAHDTEPEEDAADTAEATTNPYLGILANIARLSPEQIREIMPDYPSVITGYNGRIVINGEPMATSYNYTAGADYASGDWLKSWSVRSEGRPLRATSIKFDATGVATELASSDEQPRNCESKGGECCRCNPCCACGYLRS